MLLQWLTICTFQSSCNILSASSLDICTKTGTTDGTSIDCEKKIVLSVTLENGQSTTEAFEFNVSEVTDSEKSVYELEAPLKVVCTKNKPKVKYSLTSAKLFYYSALETVKIPSGLANCVDGPYALNPTCGRQYDLSSGQPIPYSEGFCCTCNESYTSSGSYRYHKACSRGYGSSNGHCLSFVEPVFMSFDVGQAQLDWEITCAVYATDSETGQQNREITRLSPSAPTFLTSTKKVLGKVIGDFLPSVLPTDFSLYKVMIPSSPSSSEIVKNSDKYTILVPSLKVSTDGLECNKIGTSFGAFYSQGSRCYNQVGTCLSNQIKDLIEADQKLIAAGKDPNYLSSKYPTWKLTHDGTSYSFTLDIKEMQQTLITLEVAADSVRLVQNKADGTITDGWIETFEAMTKGYLHTTIRNNGTLSGSYLLSVRDCSNSISTTSTQTMSLAPGENHTTFFTITTDETLAADNHCTLYLENNLGEVLDSRYLPFNTTQSNPDKPPVSPPTSGDEENVTSGSNCSCTMLDLVCIAPRFSVCMTKLIGSIAIYIGILAGVIVLIIILCKCGPRMCRCLCTPSRRHSSSRELQEDFSPHSYHSQQPLADPRQPYKSRLSELMQEADMAWRQHKRQGRSQTAYYPPPLPNQMQNRYYTQNYGPNRRHPQFEEAYYEDPRRAGPAYWDGRKGGQWIENNGNDTYEEEEWEDEQEYEQDNGQQYEDECEQDYEQDYGQGSDQEFEQEYEEEYEDEQEQEYEQGYEQECGQEYEPENSEWQEERNVYYTQERHNNRHYPSRTRRH
ncbi:putative Hapless 2 protein [Blattamonas nauphoetae]|uniref:Hapless 2 protein n=1 Tax=Blattamonas nauphoetae TaxID=2049346 RepID=A0ABQ9YLW2_9EUKA|nr:putative Hapless 2 protein [Blattamonas nauphoetae]